MATKWQLRCANAVKQCLLAVLLVSLCFPVFARPELATARTVLQNAQSNHSLSSIRNQTALQNAHSQQSLVMQSHIRSSAISRINTEQNNQMASCCLITNPINTLNAVKTSPDFVSSNASLVNPKDFKSNTQGLMFITSNFEVVVAPLNQVDGSKLGRGMFRGGGSGAPRVLPLLEDGRKLGRGMFRGGRSTRLPPPGESR